jgi:hypothetical protein
VRQTAEWYSTFAEVEARGQSAVYYDWATGVAGDDGMRALIERLPLQKRQPNLVFAVSRLLGAPASGFLQFRAWFFDNFTAVAAEAMERMTQTNEPRRCASLLPALGLLEGPLALLEVGASAGLCLFPDRYSYRYNDGETIGSSAVLLDCAATGPVPIPTAPPEVVWRAGIDLHPLDVRDDDDMLWLETLVWPEQDERRQRRRAAIEIARADPPRLVRGDATLALADLAAEAPSDASLVVISSGVLVYLTADERLRFAELVRGLGVEWVSLEGRGALPKVEAALPSDTDGRGRFVLALNERPLAYTGPHGQSIDWF